jgi:hypothetical protein
MRRVIVLALLVSACAHPTPATPPAAIKVPAPVHAVNPPCVIPTPPTADDLSAAQAAHGLVGRDALLTAYAKVAFSAKAACNRSEATK